MEKSLFQFIWKYSKRNQLILSAITLLTFPILYVSLELPKRIINDAIGGTGEDVTVLGVLLSQTEFLMVLCVGFLVAVLANGLLKMKLNTMKGVLAERLLRRFRFQMVTRILRFPRSYFRTTSQGELVSMVTSEAEPMGSLMGDMLSRPILQTGQMLTILAFLFAQSFWFGLASITLIPLQAWIIPKLQRQINLLNKARIQEIRKLAADIGETAAGVSDIRTNGGVRHRLSLFSNRLGKLFGIRFEIYQKKFFMKFLNNFINQLTPFFFYSVGGYLAIQGEITVGALVAALAAYKDLSSPWKELLTYYNQTQDMALRWEVVTERFSSKTLVDDTLFDGEPDTETSLNGDIELKKITVRDEDGHAILEDINLTIPKGARVAIKTNNESSALAFADLLTREVIPYRGSLTIAGNEMNGLHQTVVANRIGYANSKPYIFKGTLGENLLMPFNYQPILDADISVDVTDWQLESARSGNSVDPFKSNWVVPKTAGFQSYDEIKDWWFQLVEAMGTDDLIVRRGLRSRLDPDTQSELVEAIVQLRPEIAKRLAKAGLDDIVHTFDPEKFNPVSPLGSNLLYAVPTKMLTQLSLSQEDNFVQMLQDEGIADYLAHMSANLIEGLTETFGTDGTDHPLFRRLNMDEDLYHQLRVIVAKRRLVGQSGLSAEDFALMLTVPFAFSAEQIGPSFTDLFKQRILQIRMKSAHEMVAKLDGLFKPIDPQEYFPVMSVLGNAIFGRISSTAGAREKLIEDVIVDVLKEHGLRRLVAQSLYDVATTQGGENLPAIFRERLAFSRAGIKKPDILILRNALASHEGDARALTRRRISELMPDSTQIFIENHFLSPESYDLFVEIVDGRIDGIARQDQPEDDDARQDLKRKLRVIGETDLFGQLDLKQQRLLAFSAQWYKAKPGQAIFSAGEEADAAYLCVKGSAGLYWPATAVEQRLVTEILPGRLIGDLAVIHDSPRLLDLIAIEDCVFLRIGASELIAVIENDAMVAASLLRTVASHLSANATNLRAMRAFAIERGIDFSELDKKEASHDQ
ncbi:cyclic nucleotide-binding domain-containing protein [Moritella marina ATCC 15381]|uniref:Cyclic nucleotide-binding domain-containing protein n=1 Tax=Moritella marina ATCC 15381 TaxID=1202962 RepID=A0A5J6WI96_MORMI|nr:ABC transporter transmembrane domain-containing protein [Moritella marina]QFI37314.1 cyclic nucleotide-binding domain-containing protein [Moritella marina ATCC 15381]